MAKDNKVDLTDLEKSWNDSRAAALALLGETTPDTTELEKAKKDKGKDSEGDSDMEYDEEDGDEDEGESEEDEPADEEEKEHAKKSLEDQISDDPEAVAAMDIEPFLRALVKGLDAKFTVLFKAVAYTQALAKSNTKMFASFGDLQKAVASEVREIGDQPQPSTTVLRKSGERFSGKDEGASTELNMTKDQVLQKAMDLMKSGKLESIEVTKITNRLNKGIALDERWIRLLKEDK